MKRYGIFGDEMNIFALPGIELRFLGCLARYLPTIRV